MLRDLGVGAVDPAMDPFFSFHKFLRAQRSAHKHFSRKRLSYPVAQPVWAVRAHSLRKWAGHQVGLCSRSPGAWPPPRRAVLRVPGGLAAASGPSGAEMQPLCAPTAPWGSMRQGEG